MTHRTLGNTSLPAIGLGCMSLSHGYGTPPPEVESISLIHKAIDAGYTHLDTARLYGLGKNEALVGKALRDRREKVFLASKCGIVIEGQSRRIDCTPNAIRAAVDTSLATLQTDFIDLYYLHRRDFNTPIEDSIGALADLVRAGKIGAIGLSEMSAETLRRAHAVHPIAAMQTEYSPWSRNPEIAVLKACEELGTTFVAFSPVARGVLAGALRDPSLLEKGDLRSSQPRFDAQNWPANLELVDKFIALAADAGVTPAQLCLSWVLSRGPHVHAIPGTTNPAHMAENFSSLTQSIDPEAFDAVDALINPDTVSGPRYAAAMQQTIDTEEFV